MRRLFRITLVLLFICTAAASQNANGLVMRSVDPESDSLALKAIRRHMAKIRKTRPTVALVLSGGGAKGAAHIGVMKYLEEKKIPVDMVVGTSMGGLMGGLYSLGYSASEIDSLLRGIDWNVMMSDMIPPEKMTYRLRKYRQTYALRIPFHYEDGVWKRRTEWGNKSDVQKIDASLPDGYLYGLNVYNMLGALSVGYQDSLSFLDLPIPFCCVAGDVVSMKQKNWTGGSLIDAMRSTMSIPVYFKPIRRENKIYVDGGIKDNFPIDIAIQTGADIIIGVDLSQFTEYEDIHNIFSILMQSMSSIGDESFAMNQDKATVYLHPDMTGYNMLSFGKEEIAELIQRGYDVAEKHKDELQEIARRTGACGRTLTNTPALDVNKVPILVDKIYFEGLTPEEEDFFHHKIADTGTKAYIDKTALDNAVYALYGTNRFNSVYYRIEGREEPFDLVFVCEKKPIHEIGFGIRGDTEQAIEISTHLGFNYNTIWGHKVDITAALSISPQMSIRYSYVPKRGPSINLSLKTGFSQRKGRDFLYQGYHTDFQRIDNFREYCWDNDLRVYLGLANEITGNFNIGLSVRNMPYYYAPSDYSSVPTTHEWNTYSLTAFLHGEADTRDDIYFPTRGIRVSGSLDYLITGYSYSARSHAADTYYASLSLESAIPIGKRFAFIPSIYSRAILGDSNKLTYMRNIVGGDIAGRYIDHQMPFFGINRLLYCTDTKGITAIARLDARTRIWKKLYASAVTSYFLDYNVNNIYEKNSKTFNDIFAIGGELNYDSILGPIKVNLHWDTGTHSVGAYASIGYDF